MDKHFRAIISALIIAIIIGTVAFHSLEDWTWIQSFYFSIVTLTTVGYGDLTPTSDASRLATALYIMVGVVIGISALTALGNAHFNRQLHILRLHRSNKKLRKS